MERIVISLQKSLDILPDGVLIVNDQGIIVATNSQVEKLFGYKHMELKGSELKVLIPNRYHDAQTSKVETFFNNPSQRNMGEGKALLGLKKDGTEIDVDIAISGIIISKKKMVIAVIRDITEKKKLERALKWRNEQLEVINQELEQFGFTISHDLKSPLANIQAIIHLITRALPLEKQTELQNHIEQLNQTLQAMSDLITGVAAYSKATLSETEEGEVNMNEVMLQLRNLVLLPPYIKLQIDQLPVTWGNKTKLLQVFLNLVGNAIKYNDKEKGVIRISGGQHGSNVLYCIEDNGPGIDPKLRKKVFRLFEKGESKRKDSQGIGLAIAHKVINEQGGTITIEDSEFGGALFKILLPGIKVKKEVKRVLNRSKNRVLVKQD